MMYRDGEPVVQSKIIISPDAPTYRWEDSEASGTHWYNLRILPFLMLTSPIVVEVAR
jgi:hypothetical protein